MAVHIGTCSTCFQSVPFESMKNMDCSEEENIASLLLAEKGAPIHNKNRSICEEYGNKETNKETHKRFSNNSIMRSYVRCFTYL